MLTFIDLFAGCGGFSSGLRSAGMVPVAEVEIDEWASGTLRANFEASHVMQADIREIDDATIQSFSGVDVVVGGPPCQGFSVAGTTQFRVEDPRNELFRWFLHWTTLLKPAAAIIENVPSILTRDSGSGGVLKCIRECLEPLGYCVEARVLNAADFGVPQLRKRAFIVAVRGERDFQFPSATHRAKLEGQGDFFLGTQAYTTVDDALSDLPSLNAGEGTDDVVPYARMALNAYQALLRDGSAGVTNHVAMRHTSRLVERFKIIEPGQSLKDVPSAHGQIAKLTGRVVANPFKYNNYRLEPSRPSLAIPASFQSLFLHPEKHRNLTAREAARLMGFADQFRFTGKRTTMSWEKNLSQYNQIGNAVCPPVAKAIGQSLICSVIPTGKTVAARIKSPVADAPKRRPTGRAHSVPDVRPISDDSRLLLRRVAEGWTRNDRHFLAAHGLRVPIEALPLALVILGWKDCPVCSRESAPFGNHTGEICFLISKDGVDTLVSNEKEHGLDYHLRTLLNIPHQSAHIVGEALEDIGAVSLVEVINPRTGRKVRGIKLLDGGPAVPPDLASRIREALEPVFVSVRRNAIAH